jgi:DNA modification methylase
MSEAAEKFLIDRRELPYDAFVADPAWLCPVGEQKPPGVECVLIHDNFQNFKSYTIPRAQLVIADIPYNIAGDFYASRPDWYVDGDNKNGESEKAHKAAFHTDFTFNIAEFFHFCNRLLKKDPGKGEKDAPCMIVFCAFQQIPKVIQEATKYGFKNYIPLVFCKNYSPQVLKANMRIVGATEYGLVLYRGKLPKFRNTDADGKRHMIFNWFEWRRDGKEYPKIHPSQKPVSLLKQLIEIFTDPGDVVIDPCAGSGSTLRAASELGRRSYGFEVSRDFYRMATEQMLKEEAI